MWVKWVRDVMSSKCVYKREMISTAAGNSPFQSQTIKMCTCQTKKPQHLSSNNLIPGPGYKQLTTWFRKKNKQKKQKQKTVIVTLAWFYLVAMISTAQCCPSLCILQATAVISAAPFPLPSSDLWNATWHWGAKSCSVSCMILEKLHNEEEKRWLQLFPFLHHRLV